MDRQQFIEKRIEPDFEFLEQRMLQEGIPFLFVLLDDTGYICRYSFPPPGIKSVRVTIYRDQEQAIEVETIPDRAYDMPVVEGGVIGDESFDGIVVDFQDGGQTDG